MHQNARNNPMATAYDQRSGIALPISAMLVLAHIPFPLDCSRIMQIYPSISRSNLGRFGDGIDSIFFNFLSSLLAIKRLSRCSTNDDAIAVMVLSRKQKFVKAEPVTS